MKSIRTRPVLLVAGIAVLLATLVPLASPTASVSAAEKSGLFSRFKNEKKVVTEKPKKELGPLDYPMVGDRTGIDGLGPIKVEGVGLVVGLDRTGSDPIPNPYRDQMLSVMNKKEIYQPADVLASPDTSLVLLRAFIPAGAREGDMVDVEVWVPPGDATTSLKGGRLLEAEMFPAVIARGKRLTGDPLLSVEGPILVNTDGSDEEVSSLLRKGKVIGQGRVLVDRDFRVIQSNDNRNKLATKRTAHWINQRFGAVDRRDPVAVAKDDKVVQLKMLRPYRYDIERFLLVVRRIPESASQSFIQGKMEYLKDELNDPATTIDAALRLEAFGHEAIPVLEGGLKSKHEIVRFCSAQALAYMGNPSGAEILGNLAAESNDFRAYALSSLVALDHPASRMALSKLLHSESVECRYGAFRALWAYDEKDPLVAGTDLNGQFHLHVIQSQATPLVHLSRNFRREIVVFNENQEFRTPVLITSGNLFLTASEENNKLQMSSITSGPEGTIRKQKESDLRVVDVIKAAVELGATYPDIVDILQQASEKKNLPGRLEVNAIPRTLPLETLNAIAGADARDGELSKRRRTSAPSLFSTGDSGQGMLIDSADSSEEEDDEAPTPAKRRTFFDYFRRQAN